MPAVAFFKFLAKNPPSIAIAGGILLLLAGAPFNNNTLTMWGGIALLGGIGLQVLWLRMI